MARNGSKILDSDMHGFEPHDLYVRYMDPKWGDRIPKGESRKKHGQIKFKFGDGRPMRVSSIDAIPAAPRPATPIVGAAGDDKVAVRYKKAFRQNFAPAESWKDFLNFGWRFSKAIAVGSPGCSIASTSARSSEKSSPLSLKPSEYFLRQCFISVDVDEDIVADVIRRIGDDNIVISTDYPHADSHWPHAVDSFMALEDLRTES
jgi:hypothetical protein